jgi:hypothetical protein
MFNSLNSSRFNRTLRAAGLAVTIASLAAACGSTTDTPATQAGVALPDLTNVAESSPAPTDTTTPTAEVESETSGADNAPLAPVEQSPLQQSDPPQPSGSNPQPAPATGQTPQPQPDSAASAEELSPDPNTTPVLDVVRVTRRGVHVSVGINASDAEGDSLALSVIGVLDSTGETFEHAADSDSGIFEMPFGPGSRGTVTVTTTVSDGVDATQQVDQTVIAPLQKVTVGPGEIVAAKGCFKDNGKITFHPSPSNLLLLDTRGVSSNLHTSELASPITLDLHNTGSQLFRTGISAEFEEEEGFASELGLRGTFGDIDVHFGSGKVQPGRYQSPNFVSPSDAGCWVQVGYVITVQPAG